jgi:CubicO group peptidase (beta-lactamase class C family)
MIQLQVTTGAGEVIMNFLISRRTRDIVGAISVIFLAAALPQTGPTPEAQVDRIFEAWNRSDTPGAVIGVAVNGKPALVRCYGMANLEYGVSIRPETIFESGSVAKQFTAACVALLALDGKLSLDDRVRKYLPEVPDFGAPILIRHLLNHTSGLRSQWPLLSLSGREPGMAVHTVDEILELVGRMKELNFKPGDEYLYCNTGYTLLGVIVRRVSGKSLSEFSRERLFEPLGMAHTRWRDDFTAIVRDRAVAYSQAADGSFRTSMPFTNVVGNGGLLTTVGDLLIWNENLDTPRIGGRAMVETLQTRGRLNDGFEIEYGAGLGISTYKGVREISHSGSTAGYRTFLARYPDERVSIAVLSNAGSSNPARLARQVADIYLAGKTKEPPKTASAVVPAEMLKKLAGVYREPLTDAALRVELDKDGKTLKIGGQPAVPVSQNAFVFADGDRRMEFGMKGIVDSDGGRSKPRFWEAMRPFAPKPEEIAAFRGTYYCDEIDTAYTVSAADGKLKIGFRPAIHIELAPVYEDAFEAEGDVVRFTRGPSGAVDGFLVYAGRVRHLRFVKR